MAIASIVWGSPFRGSAFVCLLAFFATIQSSLADTFVVSKENRPRENHDKVKVELYYMPQCPGCRQLITTSFDEAFNTPGFSDMADVTFVPYHDKRHNSPVKRAFDNVLESCALSIIGRHNQDQQFAYINCIDHYKRNSRDPSKVDRACARVIGLSGEHIDDIETCADSELGHALAERNYLQSESTGLRYFPWIVVNLQHTTEIENAVWESLFEYVCEIYSGPNRSEECPYGENDDGDFDDQSDDEYDDNAGIDDEFESEAGIDFHDDVNGFGGEDDNFSEQL